jgi:hypothetical protein
MLLFDITSQSSFDRISNYHDTVLKTQKRTYSRVLVVGVLCDPTHTWGLIQGQGELFAQRIGGRFLRVDMNNPEAIHDAFRTILEPYWEFRTGLPKNIPPVVDMDQMNSYLSAVNVSPATSAQEPRMKVPARHSYFPRKALPPLPP